jgi:hypothetical protein
MSLLATAEPAERPRTSVKRRIWSWVGVVAIVVVIGSLLATLRFDYSQPEPLSIDSPRYDGTRALAALLERQGVEVEATASAADARAMAADGAVLVVTDATRIEPAELRDLADDAPRTVILSADFVALDEFFPGIGFAGSGDGSPVDAACEIPEAAHAGAIIPGELYRASDATGCYPSEDGYALVTDGTVYALDGLAIVTNEHLAQAGHAALALGLLGQAESVAWYSPSGADLTGGATSLGDVVPTWVTPLIVLAALVAVAAAVWRGRRFGPLVAENLPVTVRAAETLEGRARLYRDGLDAAHAYDALRRGSASRMARRVGLPPGADPDALATAVAGRTGRDRREALEILTVSPADDTHLAEIGARLREIEAAFDASHPSEGRSR